MLKSKLILYQSYIDQCTLKSIAIDLSIVDSYTNEGMNCFICVFCTISFKIERNQLLPVRIFLT